jgi:hypothetical protein
MTITLPCAALLTRCHTSNALLADSLTIAHVLRFVLALFAVLLRMGLGL